MSEEHLQFGEVNHLPVYGTDDFEVIIQTAWRGGPRRLALCTNESDAISICNAVTYAIKNGILE